jgi:hypothetical protein
METATPPTATLTERLAEAMRLIDEAIADARSRLATQADNPAIHRLTQRAFVLPLSEVLSRKVGAGAVRPRVSWAAFDHDWLAQYEHARELLAKRHFGALQEMLSNGGYRSASHGFRGFAPEVVENIKRITGDLRSAVKLTDMRGMTEAALLNRPEEEAPAGRRRNRP